MGRGSGRSGVVLPAVAGYATAIQTLTFGAVAVRIATVARLEDHVDVAALLRDADAPEPPYWAHLWPGSRALARIVATEIRCAGRRVIDVGCGLGLVGVVAARRDARSVLLDRVADATRFARVNVGLNGVKALVVQGDLLRPPLGGEVDHCFAADVTYDPSLQDAMADFLATRLAPDGCGWCAESVRTFDARFADACAARGLRVETRELRVTEDGREVPVRLQVVRRAGASPAGHCPP